MPYPRSRAHHLSMIPIKQGVSRAGLALLVGSGVVLLAMSKAGSPAAERVRMGVADVISPVLSVAAKPIDAIVSVGQFVSEMATLRSENVALKNQNVQLKLWQLKAQEMETETQALRGLLKVVPPRIASYVTAPVVSDLGGPYVHSALVGGGSENGIGKDRAVINENGLVGRVVEVGESSARVLLLTDINSRVPVMVESTRQ
ncbi:MAG: rod shape-determining protein MreC, partial [Alphaproteobacteria bacterium]|nr:rod shape-determining protein MreC [Alphaproteobacteria bacterium]